MEQPTALTLGRRCICTCMMFGDLLMCSALTYSFIPADINDLFGVYTELLNVAHNWRGVGRALRLHPHLLNRIEANTTNVETRLEKTLSEWLKREYDTTRFGLPSWELLVAAVAHPAGGKNHALAGQIAGRHNGKWRDSAPLYVACLITTSK